MTNEELKKKIQAIILNTEITGVSIRSIVGGYSAAESIADALISAGIGDVSELKKHRVVVEKSLIPEDDNAYVLPNIPPTVKQLYSGEEVEQIVKEREEYKHRAEVAERALYNLSKIILDMQGYEKWDISILAKEIVVPDYIKQAEKELAEEEKNEQRNVNV